MKELNTVKHFQNAASAPCVLIIREIIASASFGFDNDNGTFADQEWDTAQHTEAAVEEPPR
jgi:hypothetical protein